MNLNCTGNKNKDVVDVLVGLDFPETVGEEEQKEWVPSSDDTLAYYKQKTRLIEQCDQVCIRIIRCFITSEGLENHSPSEKNPIPVL